MRAENRREERYAWERANLAPWAYLSEYASERDHADPDDNYRTRFQRDRDRVLGCAFFRQLSEKTQVFLYSESDVFRRRLTHVLEVHRLALTLSDHLYANNDLVSAIAYCHDIGHLPFGHASEETITEQMKLFGQGARTYPHAAHGLRVVECLADENFDDHRYFGLNLTREVREGVLKHSGPVEFSGEEFAAMRPSSPCFIEGQVVQKADLVASLVADFDDAIRIGLVKLSDLLGVEGLMDYLNKFRKGGSPQATVGSIKSFSSLRSKLTWSLMQDVIDTTYAVLRNGFPGGEAFDGRTGGIVHKAEDIENYIRKPERLGDTFPGGDPRRPDYMLGWVYPNIVRLSRDGIRVAEGMWKLRSDKVWASSLVTRMNEKAKSVIGTLCRLLAGQPKLMYHRGRPYSEDLIKEKYMNLGLDLEGAMAGKNPSDLRRLVVDYIASLSDMSAIEEYQRLTDPQRHVVRG